MFISFEFWIREDTLVSLCALNSLSVNKAIAISLRRHIWSIRALLFVLLMSGSCRVLLHANSKFQTTFSVNRN